MTTHAPGSFIRPPADVEGWVRYFGLAEIPVLSGTAAALEDLRLIEDDVDARTIAQAISRDPLMILKLLACVATQRSKRRDNDAETATEALVLMGITPFFRVFGPQPTIEMHLAAHPQALEGLTRVLARGDRAGRFAAAFAVHRGDHDAVVLHEAALLHDFAEMLLWLHAPDLALEIQQRQEADPTLRSCVIQRELLNATLNEIQVALMTRWHLPEILVRITDERQAENSQVRTVLLAIRVARHTMNGWDNAAVPDDVRDISGLLMLNLESTRQLLGDVDG